MIYILLQYLVRFALFCYYRDISLRGWQKARKGRSTMFLANHQNGLMDPLILAAFLPHRPYFLTRADVFRGRVFSSFFNFLRMIPVYRLRDGLGQLEKNQRIFARCSQLLQQDQALALFPEANHNLRRQVRPLSKGFVRILHLTAEKAPDKEIYIVPVGMNYQDAESFPDRVALEFGELIPFREFFRQTDLATSIKLLKGEVSQALEKLTTHISPETDYDKVMAYLHSRDVDFTRPELVNELIRKYPAGKATQRNGKGSGLLIKPLFTLLNFPVIIFWRMLVVPRIPEPEFTATYRFVYGLFALPIYYLLVFTSATYFGSAVLGTGLAGGLFLFNLAYVRAG